MRGLKGLALAATLMTAGALLLTAAPAFAGGFDVAAHTSLTRTYTWSIQKVAHDPSITLAPGATFMESYDVTVTNTGSVDSNWKVSDGIHYYPGSTFTPTGVNALISPDNIAATISDPTDDPSRCSSVLNTAITDLYCAYSAALPDGSPQTVTATIALQGGGSVSTSTPFDFTNPDSITTVNQCVQVADTLEGNLGQVCAANGPTTFSYTMPITAPQQCGDFDVTNTASLNDDAVHPSSSTANVHVQVPCAAPGCTLTIGYWKTHAGFRPQADVVTPLLPQWLGTAGGAKSQDVTTAALAVQFLSFDGSNNVFAASNGINKLYAQLLAAKLNIANGASGSAIASTISAADAFLAANDSLSWSELSKASQNTVLGWMTALDNYNNGLSGPAHCG